MQHRDPDECIRTDKEIKVKLCWAASTTRFCQYFLQIKFANVFHEHLWFLGVGAFFLEVVEKNVAAIHGAAI